MILLFSPSFSSGSGDTASGGSSSPCPFPDTSSAISNSTTASPPLRTPRCSSACSDGAGEKTCRNPSAGTLYDEAAWPAAAFSLPVDLFGVLVNLSVGPWEVVLPEGQVLGRSAFPPQGVYSNPLSIWRSGFVEDSEI
jgi:hypothetical protein